MRSLGVLDSRGRCYIRPQHQGCSRKSPGRPREAGKGADWRVAHPRWGRSGRVNREVRHPPTSTDTLPRGRPVSRTDRIKLNGGGRTAYRQQADGMWFCGRRLCQMMRGPRFRPCRLRRHVTRRGPWPAPSGRLSIATSEYNVSGPSRNGDVGEALGETFENSGVRVSTPEAASAQGCDQRRKCAPPTRVRYQLKLRRQRIVRFGMDGLVIGEVE